MPLVIAPGGSRRRSKDERGPQAGPEICYSKRTRRGREDSTPRKGGLLSRGPRSIRPHSSQLTGNTPFDIVPLGAHSSQHDVTDGMGDIAQRRKISNIRVPNYGRSTVGSTV